jgi:hypothetical protein
VVGWRWEAAWFRVLGVCFGVWVWGRALGLGCLKRWLSVEVDVDVEVERKGRGDCCVWQVGPRYVCCLWKDARSSLSWSAVERGVVFKLSLHWRVGGIHVACTR